MTRRTSTRHLKVALGAALTMIMTLAGLNVAPAAHAVPGAVTVTTATQAARVSDAPRFAAVLAASSTGVLYATSEGGNVYSPGLYYRPADGSGSSALITAIGEDAATSTSPGIRPALVQTASGDTAVWATTDPGTGESLIKQATFSTTDGTTTANVSTLVAGDASVWSTYSYVGTNGTYLYWSTYDYGTATTTLHRTPMADTSTVTEFAVVGETLAFFAADTTKVLLAYTDTGSAYNGVDGRIALLDAGTASAAQDTSIIGSYPAGGLGSIALAPDAAVWIQSATNGTIRNVLHRRTNGTTANYTGLVSSLNSTITVSAVKDPQGYIWMVWIGGTSDLGGSDTYGYGPVNVLKTGTAVQGPVSSAGYGLMAAGASNLYAYTLEDPASPEITKVVLSGTTATVSTFADVDYRPASVSALALGPGSVWMSEKTDENYTYRLVGRPISGTPASIGTPLLPTGITPKVISGLADLGGNLDVTDSLVVFPGQSIDAEDWSHNGLVAISPQTGDHAWTVENSEAVTVLGANEYAIPWQAVTGSGTSTFYTTRPSDGDTSALPGSLVAAAAHGGVRYSAASGQIATVTRTHLISGSAQQVDVDPDCTVMPREAYGQWLLYDCAGAPRIAKVIWSGGAWTTTITNLDASRTWHLGDGFLAWRSGQPGVDRSFTFGITTLPDLTDQALATVDNYSTDREAPQFTASKTGEHRVAYLDGDATLTVATLGITETPSPAPTITTPPVGFSPNGNGVRDTWRFQASAEVPYDWALTLTNQTGTVVRTFTGQPAAAGPQVVDITWDGLTDAGTKAPDGTYTWSLRSVSVTDTRVQTQTGTVALTSTVLSPTTTAPAGFTPNADGTNDRWLFTGALPTHMSDWTLTISSQGTPVATFTDTDTDTALLTWDGISDADAALPAGTYTWNFTSSAANLADTAAATGTLILRTAAVTPVLTAPSAATKSTFTVSWTPSVRPAGISGWQVWQRTATRASNGSPSYGSWKKVGTTTTKTTATVTPVSRGVAIQTKVTSVDTIAGETATSATRATVVPLDERAMSFSGTWKASTASAAYLTTLKTSTAKNATATTTVRGKATVKILAMKGPKQGKFQVLLDGKIVATVDARATKTAYQQAVWTKTLTSGSHKVQVKVLATAGRPAVTLDAISVSPL